MHQRHLFESMMKETVPNVDLTRDEDNGEFYRDPGTQVAWVGYRGLTADLGSTTNNTGVNHHGDNH